jgi:putative transposase
MYYWRRLTDEQCAEVLRERKGRRLPWHSPPHWDFDGPVTVIITAACYEHKHLIGRSTVRIAEFEQELLAAAEEFASKIFAWCILPNHYHLLARTERIRELRKMLGKLHGRTARFWNQTDSETGRKVWFNFFDRNMRSERHLFASLNYIHNNAVHHRYVDRWQDWPYSSSHRFLEEVGREKAAKIWREYPVLDYGKDWDIF